MFGMRKKKRWYAMKKHRKLAGMEIAEAFEIVGRMRAVVAGVFVAATVGLGWGMKIIYDRLYW